MKYVLAFDQGTTSTRSIVFDQLGRIVALSQQEHRQIFPQIGWVEHDPFEIYSAQIKTAAEVLEKASLHASDIDSVGIANQRETTIVWNRNTGEPVCNAIVWQDRRTSEYCSEIRERHSETIRGKTGLEVDAYFSASKLSWILKSVCDAKAMAENGELAFGTVDSWLIWKLTNGARHITDTSNASRTMLFDIHKTDWDPELLNIFGIPHMLLPEVVQSSDVYGEIDAIDSLNGIKLAGIAGDQQAALFGHGCFSGGETKCTYGTGCFLVQNTGSATVTSQNRMLTTVGWTVSGKTNYALEGSVFVAGAVIQWLRDQPDIIESSNDVEMLASQVTDSQDVYFVPAFVGLGAPRWDQDARGMIIGLTRGTGKAHIARAALESIAFQTSDLLASMNADSRSELTELRVDGGATQNETLMQFQADILQIPVVRSQVQETTALGAAYLAGLATGIWHSQAELLSHWRAERTFYPQMAASKAIHSIERWHEAVDRSQGWNKK